MKSKLEITKDHINSLEDVLVCPLCHNELTLEDNSVQCPLKHTFNINKKGFLSLSEPISDKLYDKEMFLARQTVLQSEIYEPVFTYLKLLLPNKAYVVDAGSGEGSYLNRIYKPSNRHIGIDLAKEGVLLSSNYKDALWLLADLANIPLRDKSIDVVLNILSPANYEQFNRILKDDGQLIKVIVNKDYLKELRVQGDHESFDNRNVYDILERNFDIQSKKVLKYTVAVDENLSKNLFKMTPMTKHHEYKDKITEITIDLTIVVAIKKEIL